MGLVFDVGDSSRDVWEEILNHYGAAVSVIISNRDPNTKFGRWFPRYAAFESEYGAYSPEAVRLFSGFLSSAEHHRIRHEALRMLDREDPAGTFRLVDRDVIFNLTCLSIFEAQLKFRVEIYVADVTPHEFVSFLWWQLSSWRKLGILFFQPCGIGPGVLPKLSLRDGPNLAGLSPELRVSDEEAAIYANRFFDRLESQLSSKWVENQKNSDINARRARTFWSRLRLLFSKGQYGLSSSRLDFSMQSDRFRSKAWFLRNLLVLLGRRNLKYAMDKAASRYFKNDVPYVVFALHYEPERTSRPEGGAFSDQLRALLEIRRIVPEAIQVLVKEHYSQNSGALRGYLGRSPKFYEVVESLPNTRLLSDGVDLLELAEHAQVVFTLTGTIGVESSYLGTRVVYFGEPWWDGIVGAERFENLQSWDQILKIPSYSREQVRASLVKLMTERMIPGLAGESLDKSAQRWGDLPENLLGRQKVSTLKVLSELLHSKEVTTPLAPVETGA